MLAPLSRAPTGNLLTLGFLALVFLIGLKVLSNAIQLSELGSRLQEMIQRELPEARIIGEFRTLTSDLEVVVQGIALFGYEPRRHELKRLDIRRSLKKSLQAYRDLYLLPLEEAEARLLDDLSTRYHFLDEVTRNIVDLVQRGQRLEARALFLGAWKKQQRATSDALTHLSDYEIKEVVKIMAKTEARIRAARTASIALAALGIVLSLALGAVVTFSLTRPVAVMRRAIERVKRGDPILGTEIQREHKISFLAHGFNEMLERLQGSLEDAFHEIRTPVAILQGEAELALRGPEKTATEYREALTNISDSAKQIWRLVDGFMFLTRSEVGQIQYVMETLSISSLLGDVARQSRALGALKGVALTVDRQIHDGAPLVVRGDAQRLRQLFVILLDNAIKYTDSGGEVAIAVEPHLDSVGVVVRDTGIGIPEKDLPKVFRRFYRVEGTRSECRGSGLGLTIAMSIVHMHQGKIMIDSQPGQGTEVSIVLPRPRDDDGVSRATFNAIAAVL